MDATPVTLGQRFSGYAAQVEHAIERIEASMRRLLEVPLGGTAVGTGLNAEPGFAAAVIEQLRQQTGLDVREAPNHFEAHAARDGLVEAGGALRATAVSLVKICNDLRWMGSGPRGGSARSACPTCSRGRRSCPARSTRCCRRPR
jgi:fumarate hydratase, class II